MKINYWITLRSRSNFQNLESTMWLAKLGKGMLFSVEQAFVGRDERQARLKMLAWEATEITEQQGNFNLFHFQYDRTWQVKMTSKKKGWPINSPNAISLDIVCWLAVISSPVKLQGKRWKDDVVMLTTHLSVTLKCLTRCKQKVVSLQFQHGGWYKSYYFVEKCHKISPLIKCKIIFMCFVNFWHQQDFNSLFKGSIGHKRPISQNHRFWTSW